MRFPIMAPAPVLEPTPVGAWPRKCEACDVAWHGTHDDRCWCCGGPGSGGRLKGTTARNAQPTNTDYQRRWWQR